MATLAVTRRHDLTDAQWAALAPLLPAASSTGRPPKWEKRQLIDGIRWRIRIGAPWRDVPAEYAPWPTIYGLFRRWQRDGTWDRILSALQAQGDAEGRIDWTVSVDSMTSRRKRVFCASLALIAVGTMPPEVVPDSVQLQEWEGPVSVGAWSWR